MDNTTVKRKSVSYGKYGLIFVLPFFIVFAIFQLYPIVYSIIISFTTFGGYDVSVDLSTFTTEKYAALLDNAKFWQSILNTFIIWIINFIPQIVLAFVFAAIFSSVSMKLRGSKAFKIIYYLPNIIMATTVAVLFEVLFEYKRGFLDIVMKAIGLFDEEFSFGRSIWGSRLVISFIQFWRYFGYTILTLAASMISINPTYYEAAKIDGCSGIKAFFKITLPLMRPIVLYTLITSLVGGLQMFEMPFLMFGSGPALQNGGRAAETAAVFIYNMAFKSPNDYAMASAASVYLFLIILALSIITFKFFGEQAFGVQKKEKIKKPKVTDPAGDAAASSGVQA